MLIKDQGFRDAVARAAAQAQRARDERDTCPREPGGCGAVGALCAVTRRGMTLCRFCPVCGWNTLGVERKRRGKAAAASRGEEEIAFIDTLSAYPATVTKLKKNAAYGKTPINAAYGKAPIKKTTKSRKPASRKGSK